MMPKYCGIQSYYFSVNALGRRSSAVHILSYMPCCGGKALLYISNATDSTNQSVTPRKLEEIFDYANSFAQGKRAILEEININSAAQAVAIGF